MHARTETHTGTATHTHRHRHTCRRAHTHAHAQTNTNTHTHTDTHVHTYTHTHTLALLSMTAVCSYEDLLECFYGYLSHKLSFGGRLAWLGSGATLLANSITTFVAFKLQLGSGAWHTHAALR